jgi:hypothetical protein
LTGYLLLAARGAVLSVGLIACGCGSAGAPRGGSGVLTLDGAIGSLRIDHSTAVQVQAFAGPADYIGAGAIRPSISEFAPYIALGYDCTRQSGGIPTINENAKTKLPGDSHEVCRTVYFVDQKNGTLAGFDTVSSNFRTAAGIRVGATMAAAKAAEHGYYMSEVPIALNERTPRIWLSVDTNDGKRVDGLTAESRRHMIGLHFV